MRRMMRNVMMIGCMCVLLVITACKNEQTEGEGLRLQSIFPKETFQVPVDLVHANDGSNRLFVVEKAGRILQLIPQGDGYQTSVYLDMTDRVYAEGSEQGLLGLAFHPQYRTNGYFYVNYTTKDQTQIASFQDQSKEKRVVDRNSERVILRFDQPYANHNGGDLAFGPDGMLYIASGDGGSGGDPKGNGQNLQTLLGKILRIDVTPDDPKSGYLIPDDNPFVSRKDDVRGEIYAYGLRNPWRISFDVETGALWTADVGQNEREEIDVIVKGGNYGWNVMEGTICFQADSICNPSAYESPVFEYKHGLGGASVTGGYVYRGQAIQELQGKYVFADFLDGRIWTLDKRVVSGGENDESSKYEAKLLQLILPQITSFGVDEKNELYALTFEGELLKFTEK